MAIKLSGLASGLDTESIIEQLMEAQSYKKTKLVNKQTKLTWTQDKWKDLNKKIYALYTEQLSKLRLQSSYQTKSATSSNEDKVTVTAGASAASGSHKIEISQLASAQYLTGGKVSTTSGAAATSTTKLTDMGFSTQGNNSVITIDGADSSSSTNVVKLTVTDTTTVKDFLDACKDAGLNASFDENQQRFFISSKDSGSDQQFTITTSNVSNQFAASETELKSAMNYSTKTSAEKKKIDAALETLQSATVDELNSLYDGTYNTADEKKAAYELLTQNVESAVEKNLPTQAKAEVVALIGTETEYIKNQLLDVVKAENPGVTDDAELKTLVDEKYKALSTEDKAKYQEEYKTLYDDEYGKRTSAEAIAQAKAEAITNVQSTLTTYVAEQGSTTPADSPLTGLGLDEITGTTASAGVKASSTSGMTLVAATEAEFTLDGAKLTSSSNTVTISGVTYTLKGITEKEETVGVTNNTQGVYDMIKGFVKEYNTLLGDMNNAYYAKSATGYDPLTDEEKEAMTDSQIEMWETKIKDSLLRRDSSLNGVITSLKSAMMSTVEVNGKQYSLSSFGICTSTDYTEKGLLHIYGDTEDSVYASFDDKLMKAIEEDPELVMEVFSGIVTNVYDAMTEKMKSTSLSSAMTFYNDKNMTKLQTQYTKDIAKLEARLQEVEDRYYKQFSAMETALAKLNSQSSYLSGLMG